MSRDTFTGDDDDFYDDEPTASAMASTPLAVSSRSKTPAQREEEKEAEADRIDGVRDLRLWAETPPESPEQARFLGNLSNRLLRGIPRKTIDAMTVRDRVSAARQCYDMRQLELNRPTLNINFTQRQDMMNVLPALKAEMERRARERATIDISPAAGAADDPA